MFDVEDLYQQVIVDHSRKPRNFHTLENANRKAEGYNPLCGDKLTIYMRVENGIIEDLAFEGSGCAISVASASLMTQLLKGRSEADAERIFNAFHEMVTGADRAAIDDRELGKLKVLAGVRHYPSRIKCATLCWHTLNAALRQLTETVATE
jgi:nitrogen fixation NifU-like protein